MTLRGRIGLGMAAAIAVTLGTILVGWQALDAAVRAEDQLLDGSAGVVRDAYQLESAVNRQAASLRGALLTGDPAALDVGGETIRELQLDIVARGGAELEPLVAELEAARVAWEEVGRGLVGRKTMLDAQELARAVDEQLIPAFGEVEDRIQDIVAQQQAVLAEERTAANAAVAGAVRRLWILGLAGMALVVGVGVVTARHVNRRVADLARSIDESGAEVLASTEQQASTAAELAAAVQQTLSTVEELAQTARETADRARTVADSAQRSAETAEAGRRAIGQSVEGMDDVRAQSDHVARSILSLAERARDISDIVETVRDIADQTHLLALNAAIEAARAGEHGRGFSVVAGEVRALAEESRGATVQIGDILGEIQDATNGAVMATERGTHSVNAGAELVTAAGETIEDLNELISAATLAAEQIAGSAGQQASATSQITDAMRDVRTAIDQSAASARQSESAARGLDRVAAELKALVGVR